MVGDAAVAAHGGEAVDGVGASPAAGDAALAEDDRDLVERVLIQQAADQGDGRLGGGVGFPGGQRARDGQGAVLPAGQPDVRGDRVAVFEQGDVGDQQPDEPLTVLHAGGGVAPQGGQVGRQGAGLPELGLGERAGRLLGARW